MHPEIVVNGWVCEFGYRLTRARLTRLLSSPRCGTTACSLPLAVVAGIVLIVIAVVYLAEPAKSLPASSPATRPARATTTRSTGSPRSSSGSPASCSHGSAGPASDGRALARGVILASLISYPRAIVLGLLQGVSELFPISSLGHTRDPARLLGWNIHQNDKYFLTFLVATHLATAIVLLGFFWRDWVRILKGLGRSLRDRGIDADRHRREARLAARRRHDPGRDPRLLLQDTLRKVFASPTVGGVFLIANGVLLYGAELLRRRAPQASRGRRHAHRAPGRLARRVLVGAAQALALIPGFSRSGATMGGGLLVGLSNKDAARFAFLLATPIIGAAALLKLPELFGPDGRRRARPGARRRRSARR